MRADQGRALSRKHQHAGIQQPDGGNGRLETPLDIGCGGGCSGVIATTKGWGSPWFSDSQMNINQRSGTSSMPTVSATSCCTRCCTGRGDDGSADHNDSSGAGNDTVYSCGRYCGRCSHAGHGSQNNSSVDCAGCADTKARKNSVARRPSTRLRIVVIQCPGFATPAWPASRAPRSVRRDCDQRLRRLPDWRQCNLLSELSLELQPVHDLPCTNAPASTDTCTDK